MVSRDDEHCSSLMLAATRGHSIVMRCLLDNQANVNDYDKNKVSIQTGDHVL